MSLFSELQRRNVLRVAMAYVALAWLVVQVLDTLAPLFGISDGAARLIVILMAIGLVPVLAISWLFELTPQGFKLDRDVDHSSASSRTSARRLDRLIIGVLALAVVYFAVDKFVIDPSRDQALASEAADKARAEALVGSFGNRSIAVMPFVDASADESQAYLSDGIAEEIINLLSTVQDIRVISRSSSFALRDRALSLAEVAEQLDVRYIMEGSVRRAGEQLRVTAQMIDPRTGTALWSQSFDRAFGDIFAIQDEIASEVVDKLEVELMGSRPNSTRVDPEAYALYLRAKNLLNREDWGAVQEARLLLEQSLAIDERHAEAWLLFWPINSSTAFYTKQTMPEFALKTREAIEKALEVEPGNARARSLLARLAYSAMSTWDGEARALAYGMSLDALDPEMNGNVGSYMMQIGRVDLALPYIEYEVTRDPLSTSTLRTAMRAYFVAGRYEQALELNLRLRELVSKHGGLWNQGLIHLYLGDAHAALEAFNRWQEGQPESLHAIQGRALAFLALGRQEELERELKLLEAAERSRRRSELLASVYAAIGWHDQAIALLEEMIDPPRDFGPAYLGASPLYLALHDHSGWGDVLRKRGTHPEQVADWKLERLFPGPGLPPTIPVDAP